MMSCLRTLATAQPFPIVIEVTTDLSPRGPIAELSNSILATVTNQRPAELSVYFEVSLRGVSADIDNIDLNNRSTANAFDFAVAPGTRAYTLRSLEAVYEGLDVSDFDLSSVLPWQRALIEEQRILPAGTWEICIQAFDFASGLPASARTVGAGCARFQVVPRTPPRIVSPVDLDAGTWVAEIASDALLVNWVIDEPGGNTYLLEVKEFLDVDAVTAFNRAGRPQDEFDALLTLDAIPDINALQYNLVDRGIDLEPRHWYALRVTASSARSPFADQGRSNIVVFAYGVDVSAACQRPSVSASVVFPVAGDTLPYVDPYVLVEFDPACPSTVAADALLRIESPDAGVAGGTRDYEPNNWRAGPGPGAFLRSYFRRQAPANHDTYWFPEGSGYERFLPLIDFDSRHDFVRGARYTASVRLDFTHLDLALGRAEYTQPIDVPDLGAGTGGFVVGMPRPRLDYPAHDQTVRTGEALEFRFNTGQAPSRPLPPFKSMRIDGATREAQMPWLKVIEKCVFQLSKEADFTQEHLLQSKLYRIQVNTANADDQFTATDPTVGTFSTSIDGTPERGFDESRLLAQIFRPLEQAYTVVEEDTLYWRVVWLRDVDEINTLDLLADNIILGEDKIYHASPVRRLIVDDDGPGAPTPTTPVAVAPSDNDETDCTTGCEPTAPTDRTALTTVTGLTTFKIGYFAVNDLELSSTTGGTLAGTGSVTVDFMYGAKFRVAFDNVRVNAAGEAIAGEVNGVEATTPFELDDINAGLATAAGTLGQEDRVNEWLQEVPGSRLLSELVSGDPVRLPVGLDRQIDGKNILLGITALKFTTEGASVKLLYEQQLDFLAADTYLSLGGEVCLKPSGFGAEVLLHLNRDLTFDANPNDTVVNSLRLKGSSGTPAEIRSTATHIEFDCACVKSFGLQFEGDLSRERFVKEDARGQVIAGEAVGFRFGVSLNRTTACDPGVLEEMPEELRGRFRENNFLLSLDFDPFQLKRFEGWGFRVEDATVDLSSTENPAGMVFPAAYTDADFGIASGTSAELAGQLRKTWTGFYLRELSVHAPTDLHEDAAHPVFKGGVRDMIIDGEGLSVSIFLENLLDEETGSAGGWSFAIDTFAVELAKNTFRSGRLAGDIGAPLLPTTEAIPYAALLTYSPPAPGAEAGEADVQHWGFLMSLRPTGELRLPPILGRATLDDNSYVAFRYGAVPAGAGTVPDSILQSNETIGLYLSGSIDISSDNGGGGSAVSDLASTLNFTGMDFRLGYSNARGFHSHHFGLASPQKVMGAAPPGSDGGGGVSGFPVTIKDYGIDNNSRIEDRVLGATLWFEPELNFMGDDDGGFKASTRINLDLGYDLADRRFRLEGASIGCIRIGVATADGGEGKTETHGITLEGSLCFYKDATRCTVTGASGVKGDVKVGLPVGEVTLAAEFGSTSAFRYWFVDGKVVLSSGIPLGAIELIGIGGGFYYNMEIPGAAGREDARGYNAALVAQAAGMQAAPGGAMPRQTGATPDGRVAPSAVAASGFAPCPRDGSIVFELVLPVATVSKHEVFNMDVSVRVAVERGRGVRQFTIMGDGYVMADVDERATAPVKTDIIIAFERREDETKVFDASFAAYADISFGDALSVEGVTEARALNGQLLKRVAEVAFHIENPPGDDAQTLWYFRLGTPSSPAGLKVKLGDVDLAEVKHYLQVGNDVERGFMPYPPLIERLLGFPERGEGGNRVAGGGNEYTGGQSGDPVTIRYQRGAAPTAGFAMGLSFAVDLDVDAFLIYARLGFAAGFDISILDESGSKCYTASGALIDPYGYNGYYARGQIYAGIEGELGLQIKLIRTRRFALFRIGAAFQIQGGFPNPMWASGRAAISYSILGGLVEGSANVQFKVGEKCIDPKTDPFGFPLIEEIIPTDGDSEVSALVKPSVYFVLPMNEVIALPVLDEDDGTVLHTDYLRPFVHQVELRAETDAARRTNVSTTVAYSVDRKNLTLTPSELLGDMNVQLKLQLRADELVGGAWTAAQWPHASGRRGVWTSDTTVAFRTNGLPDQIPDELYARSVPVKDQRYFLQAASYANSNDQRDSKYVTFDRDLRRSYFRPTDGAPRGGEPERRYRYAVELFPYDGSASIECAARLDYRSASTVISYELPSALKNDMIYRAAVVRILERPTQSALDRARAQVGPGSVLSPGTALGVDAATRAFVDLSYRESDLFTKVQLLTERRANQPAPVSTPEHFPIFEYHFRTSRFNTLPEKMAGAETSVERRGEFYQYVQVRGAEGFDEADVLPLAVGGTAYEPLVIAHPTYGGSYWRTKAKPAYDNYAAFKYAVEGHRDGTWRRTERGWNISYGRAGGRMALTYDNRTLGVRPSFYDYPDLVRPDALYHHLPRWGTQEAVKRFTTLERRYVQRPLSAADLSQAWNRTVDRWIAEEEAAAAAANRRPIDGVSVDTRAPGTSQIDLLSRNSNAGNLGASFASSGTGSSGTTPLFVFGGAAYAPAPYRPVMLSFYYDLNDKVVQDMVAMRLSMQAYLNYKVPRYAVPLPLPYPQRAQAVDFMAARGSRYGEDIRSLVRGTAYPINSLGLSANPGTYEFGISESRRRPIRDNAPSYPYRSTLFNVTFR